VKLSVCIIVYNCEDFVSQTLDSVLTQKTDFDFEVVVGEDRSTDSSREIVADYQKRYPGLMRPIFREKNLGMVRNFAETVRACQGRYIAMVDGDDFWNSPLKLQRQADFLDAHPECSGSYHNVNVLNQATGRTRPYYASPRKRFLYLKDLLKGNSVCAGSMVFRAGLFGDFPEWYYTLPMQDWPLYVLNAQFGPAGYIDEILSTYRVHERGDWPRSNRIEGFRRAIFAAHTMNAGLDFAYDSEIRKGIANLKYKIAKHLLAEKDYMGARSHSKEAMERLGLMQFRYYKALFVYLRANYVGRLK